MEVQLEEKMMSKKEPRSVRFSPERVLVNWRALIQAIPNMNEDELRAALDEEISRSEPRKDVVMRLQRRLDSMAAKKAKLAREKALRKLA